MLNQTTADAIKRAQAKGIRFMVATGRAFKQVEELMEAFDIRCDFLVSSGAEVRTPEQEIFYSGHMKMNSCKEVYDVLKEYSVPYLFNTAEADYCIGTFEEMQDKVLHHIFAFNQTVSLEEIKESPAYKLMVEKTRVVSSFEKLEAENPKIIKIFIFTNELEILAEIESKLTGNTNIAVASSFANNLEITDVNAQKGPVLKAYIESLGYSMDEVMVFGDSMNDYSMLSMDFGATIAMDNADEKLKTVAKYVTKSNVEDGVAYTIDKLLEMQS